MNHLRKQEVAERGFKNWLKNSLLKAKQEKYEKRLMKKQRRMEKIEKRKIEERKRVEAEITFKKWKMHKGNDLIVFIYLVLKTSKYFMI